MRWTGIVPILVVLATVSASTSICGAAWETVKLESGLELTLEEEHSSPMAACIVTIGAGSGLETAAENGISHMLEHLLFDGTARRSREELTEAQRSLGAYFNAFTRRDYTCFFFVVPSEGLEEAMEIQADMLLNSILPEKEVEKERKVVVEEMNKDLSNVDYLVERYADGILYAGSPYAKPVLGARNVIENIARSDILLYYRRFYVPSNMKILLVGDFDGEKAIRMVEDSFASALPGEVQEKSARPQIHRKNEVRRVHLDCHQTYVLMNLAAPMLGTREYYAFELLSRMLSRPSSPLVLGLKQDAELDIVSVELSYRHMRSFSDATLKIISRSTDVDAIVSRALEILSGVASSSISPRELEVTKVSLSAEEIYLGEQYHYYGMFKAGELALAGGAFLAKKLEELNAVTSREVEKVARRYLKKPSFTVAAILPEAKAKNAAGPRRASSYEVWEEDNGMRVAYKYNEDSRVFAAHLLVEGRLLCEPKGKYGITEVLSRMLEKGAGEMDEKTLDEELAAIGSKLEVTDNPYIPYDDYRTKENYSFLRFETIDEFYRRGLELLALIVFEPRFDESALEDVKSELGVVISRRDANPMRVGKKLFFSTLFKGHPFQYDVLGEKEYLESISLDDLKAYHEAYFSPPNMLLSMAGNIPPELVKKNIHDLFGLRRGVSAHCTVPLPKPVEGVRNVSAQVAAPQAAIYLGNLVRKPHREELPALFVANGILSRRLAEVLREKRGLAYSVGSNYYVGRDYAYVVVNMGTSPEKLAESKTGIEQILKGLSETITEEEMELYKSSSRGRMLMRRLSRINQAYYMSLNELRGFGFEFDDEFTEAIKDVTLEQVKEAIREYIPVDDHIIAVVRPGK